MFTLQRVSLLETEKPYKILVSCGQYMKNHLGLDHWDPPCTIEDMERYVVESEVYIVSEENSVTPLATFMVNTKAFVDYDYQIWSEPSANALYLAKLGVLPEYQGSGVGTWCMREVEKLAKLKNCAAVRFDALLANHKLIRFYHCNLGYTLRDVFIARDPLDSMTDWKLAAFEKVLK